MYVYVERPRLEQLFRDTLAGKLDGRILALTGEGGMGKSRLLEKFQVITLEAGVRTPEILDFRYAENRLPSAFINTIAELAPDVFLPCRRIQDELQQSRDLGEGSGLVDYAEERVYSQFAECVDRLLNQGPLVILLDTFEYVQGTFTHQWLQSSLLPQLSNRDRLYLVVAGRAPIRFQGQEGRTQQVSVPPFSLEETRQYARAIGMPVGSAEFEEALEAIFTATRGHPVLVAWAFDYVGTLLTSKDVEQIARESQGDTELFCQRLAEQTVLAERMDLIQVACLNRRFDAEIFAYVTGRSVEECWRRIEEWLAGFSSILRQGPCPQSCELHDVVADVINRYAWPVFDPSGHTWDSLRQAIIGYYDDKLAREIGTREKQAFIAERTYYKLDACACEEDFDRCFRERLLEIFEPEFLRALDVRDLDLARVLVGELMDFEDRVDESVRDYLAVERARLLAEEGEADKALQVYEMMRGRDVPDEVLRARVLEGMGRYWYLKSDYDRSLADYKESLEIFERIGRPEKAGALCNYIGMAYWARGARSEALKWYKKSFLQALDVADEVRAASAADQVAQVAILLEDTTMAQSYSKLSQWIWEALGDTNGQARTCVTQARVCELTKDYKEAEASLTKALSLFVDASNQIGEALTRMYLGRVRRLQGRLEEAEELLAWSQDVFQKIGGLREVANVLHELGRVHKQRGDEREAEEYLKESQRLAEKIRDYYRKEAVEKDLLLITGRQVADSKS